MSGLRIALIVCAVGFAGAAAYLSLSLRTQPVVPTDMPEITAPPTRIVAVMTVKRFVARGAPLTKDDVDWQEWPAPAIPAGAFLRNAADDPAQPPANRRARSDLFPGEILLDGKLIDPANSGLLAATMGPGMRAVAARISPEAGAGGFILPGDRVDVIVTSRKASETGVEVYDSTTVLKNVRILAIDQLFTTEDGKSVLVGKTATLELTPGQAERLALAREQGTLSFALRSFDRPDAGVENTGTKPKPKTMALYRYGMPATIKGGSQ